MSNLTDPEIAMLRALVLMGPSKCSKLGDQLWPDSKGSNSCPMARPAGALLARMRKKGLTTWDVTVKQGFLHIITPTGRRLLEAVTD